MFRDREPLIAEICDRLAKGETLASICRDMHMPDRTTVFDWSKADETISQRIARAREAGFDAIAEQCLEIADDGSGDFKPIAALAGEDGNGPKAFDSEHVQRAKLRVETRLKLLAKWDPKRYGDKQQVEHSGAIDVASILSARKRSNGQAES